MQRQTIETNFLQTMCWLDNAIVDWATGGRLYFTDGRIKDIGIYHFRFNFDSCVISEDGKYSVIYQKLGTKGLLLKNGEVLREINRSYYQADAYEYPVILFSAKNGKTYLIHCPSEYCRIDFEDVETGKVITNIPSRKPSDFFHSRFEISPDKKFLISKGWGWHPYDFVELFDIEACIKNPLLLDNSNLKPDVDAEICTASFINDHLILIGSWKDSEPFDHEPSDKLKPGQMAIWNIQTNKISTPVSVEFEFGGHLVAIDEECAWDLFNYPKIVNFKTGKIEDKIEDIFTGQQVSSIIQHLDNLPKIDFNRLTKQVAISDGKKIEILTK